MSTSTTLIAFRFKTFNCRTTVKILIHIKYVKNANHLGIVRNSKRAHINIPVNIKTYLSRKFGLQLILNETVHCFQDEIRLVDVFFSITFLRTFLTPEFYLDFNCRVINSRFLSQLKFLS